MNDSGRRWQMEEGLKIFKVNTKSEKLDAGAKKNSLGKLAQFLSALAEVLGVDPQQAKPILSAYLAGGYNKKLPHCEINSGSRHF